ncbi:DNA internalization-related competence protein ComEC/Rec2 [Alkalihalobacterium sp. APHAB7]|uniref:DNA internalization-related competence protein ComEC/Rec2 n=1 Tax=Alkalihalobacterium sp. APHAB7 TaxID=3402081 RepID=UPI003AAE92CA
MTGRWHIVVLAAIISIVIATKEFQVWLLFLIAFLSYDLMVHRRRIRIDGLFLVLCLLLFFSSSSYVHKNNVTNYSSEQTSFIGTISSIPQINGDRLSFQFKTVTGEKLQTNYLIKSEQEQLQLKALTVGMKCPLQGKLRKPSPSTNFYAFDYQEFLFYQKIHWTFHPETIEVSKCHSPSFSVRYALQTIRQHGIQYISDQYPDGSKGIVTALLFGDRASMEEDVLEAYQRLGVIHLLAVSGLHVGLIFSALFFLLIRFGLTRERTIDLLLVLLPMYMVVAGGAPSVIRAVCMTVVILVSLRIKKKLHPLDGISFVCLLYLLLSPYSLYQLGFQLSFLISFTLIVSSELVSKQSHYLQQLVTVTTISQLASFPIIVFHFYEISWLSLPLNIVFIPFISLLVLPAVFLTYCIHLISPFFGNSLLEVLNGIIVYSHASLTFLNNLPFSSILFGQFDIWVAFSIIFICFVAFLFYERKFSLKRWAILMGVLTSLMFIHFLSPYFKGQGEVTMLDVGQGDSIFIELPHRKAVYLIDSGGLVSFGREEEWKRRSREFDVGKHIVVPFLKAKGIRTIDKLILTHGHYDHIGGAEALLDQVNIDEIVYAYGPVEGDFERYLLTEFQQRGTTIQFAKEGMGWSMAGSDFRVLSPQGSEDSLNNRSIVLYSTLGGVKWLFTGDLEESGEARLIRDFVDLDVDILKAGHHGSRTSSTPPFIDHIQPKIVLISAGRNNRFQHPHEEVIETFNERNIPIYRTDEHGAIRYVFSKKGLLHIETAIKQK